MLDQNLKQAYRKITPSPELKQKILAMRVESQQTKHAGLLLLKPMMTVAACLVFLLGGIVLTSQMQHVNQPTILLSGETLHDGRELAFVPQTTGYAPAVMQRSTDVVPAAHSAQTDGIAIDLHMSFPNETVISVEQGVLCVRAGANGDDAFEQIGQSMSVKKEDGVILIRWVIPIAVEDAEYGMNIGNETLRVIYHASENEYLISRADKEH